MDPGRWTEDLQLRIHGEFSLPVTLLHLPGLHGDWTLLGAFRRAIAGRACLVETSYPCRPEWTLRDYARAVTLALARAGVRQCWILGESYSSQVAWELLDLSSQPAGNGPSIAYPGLVLVGGFVRHPWGWGVRLAGQVSTLVPAWALRCACGCYGWLARRHRGAGSGEVRDELQEFVSRRLRPGDRVVINARYRLIEANDPRPVACATTRPVFLLSGAWDPIVPWWQVQTWLQRHCPGYVASRILWTAGHNVLLSAAQESAEQILHWVAGAAAAAAGGPRSCARR